MKGAYNLVRYKFTSWLMTRRHWGRDNIEEKKDKGKNMEQARTNAMPQAERNAIV